MNTYDATWLWGVGLIALAGGIALGILVAYFLLPLSRRAKELETELESLRGELDEYRGQVTRHFATTSNLFHDLTTRYRTLYDHLARGAEDLCANPQQGTPRLDFPDAGLLPPAHAPMPDGETATPPQDAAPASANDAARPVEPEMEADAVATPPQAPREEAPPETQSDPADEPAGAGKVQ